MRSEDDNRFEFAFLIEERFLCSRRELSVSRDSKTKIGKSKLTKSDAFSSLKQSPRLVREICHAIELRS